MSNVDRVALIRDRLTPCQIALQQLQADLVLDNHAKALVWAEELAEAFLDLEAATGAACTPAALFA